MSKTIFSAVVVSGLIVCSGLSAAVTTASLSGKAGATEVVTLPTVVITAKRDLAPKVVMLPAVTIVAHRDTALQVASR